ncbi:MAG: hypothetical protein J1F38_01715 [Muribaculaceae bacterium]|nr:hypothetical protein [Muribaculaceae bacterium]
MKLKSFLLIGTVLILSSCAEESLNSNEGVSGDNNGSTLSRASYTVGGGDQSRSTFLGQWNPASTRAANDWAVGLSFEKPENAVNLQENPWNNASIGYIPETFTGSIQFNVANDAVIYNYGKDVTFTNCNFNGTVTVYNAGELNWTVSNGNKHTVYNSGTLNVLNYANIGNVYNVGELNLEGQKGYEYPAWNNWQAVEVFKADIPNDMHIFSTGGIVSIPCDADFKASADIDNLVTVKGNLNIQNGSTTKHFCGLLVDGDLSLVDERNYVSSSYVIAKNISLNGASLFLTKEGYVKAENITFNGNGRTEENNGGYYEAIVSKEGSIAKVEVKDIVAPQAKSLREHFGAGVYVDFENITYYDEIKAKSVITCSADEYIGDVATQDGINNKDVSGVPECGEPWGTPSVDSKVPSLDVVAEVESPTHDHNDGKNNRHLSATSLVYDNNGNIFASYHMRGGNWGEDTYDKDDVEGCIERWTFSPSEGIQIGNWMWTDEFDFNHIYLDKTSGYVITVGHKAGENQVDKHTDFGGIIGKMPAEVWESNWNSNQTLTREDFQYKYLTTDEELFGDYENESGNVTNQKLDYKNAGDGNCVVRDGDYYLVATSAGYGKISAEDFGRIKDEAGVPLFVRTDGSAKYLVKDGENIHVLYLNERPVGGSQADSESSASLATMSIDAFPAKVSSPKTLGANISPVDGKNVIAVDGDVIYACLSKGGLQIGDNTPIKFSDQEDGSRSVNGVAVDDKYIYVANGSYVSVLDKATHKIVAERKGNFKNVSANFVEVRNIDGNRYVFVAFGQEGIKVFQLKNVD